MLDSPLWNLVYIAITVAMMGYAYYSRDEHVQKLAILTLVLWSASQAVIHTEAMYIIYAAGDVIGLLYCAHLLAKDPKRKVTQWISWLFGAFLILHVARSPDTPWLIYQIAGNLLYVAQCAILMRYGKEYGKAARREADHRRRDDPFYLLVSPVLAAWNLLKN